jgi:DNA segregation ATPase FtsK/SpoIIIE, S-DNA-T family
LSEHLPKILPIALPVVLSISMAVMFRHPAMLMFGLMGPLLALSGSWSKKRDQATATQEREAREQEQQRHLQHQLRQREDDWRDGQVHAHPAVTDWLHNPLWRPEANTLDVTVRLGQAVASPPPESGLYRPVPGVPLTIPLHTSLAVVGSGLDAVAAWRAAYCQAIAIASAPSESAQARVSVSGVWAHNADVPRTLDIPHPAGDHSTRWWFVDSTTQVPPQATWVFVISGRGHARLLHRGVITHDTCQPDAVTFAQSRWVRARLVDSEGGKGVATPDIQADDRGALWAEVASEQPAIDLVWQGPHTLVWGKTGSGKSVLVQRLVSSLCARYSPDQFALVGIDFKGGATLQPLMAHPHGAGLLTDLTPGATTRVTRSLRAEIIRREQLFSTHRVASWQDLPADVTCPRVLIVVDEAGVVAQDAPELMAVLSDVASRGRSLGLHLLISTQRPQHLPRNIIANCALRICLGVTDTDEASQYAPDIPRHLLASLRHSPPGTVLLPGRDGSYTLATVDTHLPTVSWPGYSKRPLWCDELPERVTLHDISRAIPPPPGDYLVGLADYPDRQTQEGWWYQPGTHGPLVIVGESGSGHTNCLTHLASQAADRACEVVWGNGNPAVLAWQLMGLTADPTPPLPRFLVIDRLDRILHGVAPDGRAWILDTLETVATQLSERGNGSSAIITQAPGSSTGSALLRWNATTVLLRHRDATQWALAGGQPALHDTTAPAGRGVVGEVAMQWCDSGTPATPTPSTDVLAAAPAQAVVITPDPQKVTDRVVWSPSEAERAWQEVKQALDSSDGVVFSGIPPQHMRQWLGPGHTIPPVEAAWPYGWHLHTGGVRLVTFESEDL